MMTMWNQLTESGFWTERRKRQVLAGALSLLAVTSFIEVVLIPGAIVRRLPHVPGAAMADARMDTVAERTPPAEAHPTVQLLDSLLESAETRRQKTEAREAAERHEVLRRVQSAQQSLRAAVNTADREWAALLEDISQHQQVDLRRVPFDPKTQPKELNALILSDPTAAAAWANIRRLPAHVPATIRTASEVLDAVANRLAQATFADTDAEQLHAAQRSVESTQNTIRQGRRDLDHLDVLSRANRFMSSLPERSTP